MVSTFKCLLIAAIFACVNKSTFSLMCYNCESFNDKTCGNKFKADDAFVVNCDDRTPARTLKDKVDEATGCMKMIIEVVYGQRQFLRDCFFGNITSPSSGCFTDEKLPYLKETMCHVCEENLCNSSSVAGPVSVAIALFFVLARALS